MGISMIIGPRIGQPAGLPIFTPALFQGPCVDRISEIFQKFLNQMLCCGGR
jgi:hypothetical protein